MAENEKTPVQSGIPVGAEIADGETLFYDRDVPSIYSEHALGVAVGNGMVKITFVESVFNPQGDKSAVRPTHHLVMPRQSFLMLHKFISELVSKIKDEGGSAE